MGNAVASGLGPGQPLLGRVGPRDRFVDPKGRFAGGKRMQGRRMTTRRPHRQEHDGRRVLRHAEERGSGFRNMSRRASEESRRCSADSSLARRVVIGLRSPWFSMCQSTSGLLAGPITKHGTTSTRREPTREARRTEGSVALAGEEESDQEIPGSTETTCSFSSSGPCRQACP